MPHIYGDDQESVLYGLGYAHARDRLLTIVQAYLAAAGRSAEFNGPGALEADVAARHFRYLEVAEKRYQEIEPEVRGLVEAYTAGINHVLSGHPSPPFGIRSVRAQEVVAAVRRFTLMGQQGGAKLQERQDAPHSSNSWAVSAAASAEGCAILLIDPQLPYSPESRFYQAHLCGGGLNVSGWTLAGCPFVVLGHNENVAWTVTSGGPDTCDVYEEKLNPDQPREYWADGWQPMRSETLRLKVKTADGVAEEQREVLWTRHGPVILTEGERAYAVKTTYADTVHALSQFYEMNRARDLQEFRKALSRQEIIPQNLMVADARGNIAYFYHGRCPRRPDGYDFDKPVPGWEPGSEWLGVMTIDEMPELHNPAIGFMQNCNCSPQFVTPTGDLKERDYPRHVIIKPIRGYQSLRGERVTYLLGSHRSLTAEQALAIATDCQAEGIRPWLDLLQTAWYNSSPARRRDPELARAASVLLGWDGSSDRASIGATLFYFWTLHYVKECQRTGRPVPADRPGRSRAEQRLAMSALARAVEAIEGFFGRLEVPWGEVHRLKRGDQTWPLSGTPTIDVRVGTLWSTSAAAPGEDGTHIAAAGTLAMMVALMSRPVRSYSVAVYGQSDDPASPHFDDQAPLFSERRLRPVAFTRSDVEREAESVERLTWEE